VKDHTLIVGLLSPFSDKVQTIFRFKGIAFERVEDHGAIDAIIRFPS